MATITALLSDLLDAVEGALLPYDRDGAVRYARKYWEQVASDGCIALEGPYTWIQGAAGARFYHPAWSAQELAALQQVPLEQGEELPQDLDQIWELAVVPPTAQPCNNEGKPGPLESRFVLLGPMDDCTHFLSCCIGSETHERGGGLVVKREFPTGPYGILSPGRLLQFLVDRGLATVVGSPQPNNKPPAPTDDRSFIKQLRRGDLICYWFKPKPTASERYAHAAILLTDGTDPEPRVACHTISRTLPNDMPADRTDEWTINWTFDDVVAVRYCFVHILDRKPSQ